MATLTARLERLEQQIEQTTASRNYVLWVMNEGENEAEEIERQKRERGITDKDRVIVVRFVAPPVREE